MHQIHSLMSFFGIISGCDSVRTSNKGEYINAEYHDKLDEAILAAGYKTSC